MSDTYIAPPALRHEPRTGALWARRGLDVRLFWEDDKYQVYAHCDPSRASFEDFVRHLQEAETLRLQWEKERDAE